MSAERGKEWTIEWEQGCKEGRQEEREVGLSTLRAVLIRELEKRFGPLPQEAQQCVTTLNSYEKIVELGIAVATAPSLAALGLC